MKRAKASHVYCRRLLSVAGCVICWNTEEEKRRRPHYPSCQNRRMPGTFYSVCWVPLTEDWSKGVSGRWRETQCKNATKLEEFGEYRVKEKETIKADRQILSQIPSNLRESRDMRRAALVFMLQCGHPPLVTRTHASTDYS